MRSSLVSQSLPAREYTLPSPFQATLLWYGCNKTAGQPATETEGVWFFFHFSSFLTFICCLSVILWLDKRDFRENVHTVCPCLNKRSCVFGGRHFHFVSSSLIFACFLLIYFSSTLESFSFKATNKNWTKNIIILSHEQICMVGVGLGTFWHWVNYTMRRLDLPRRFLWVLNQRAWLLLTALRRPLVRDDELMLNVLRCHLTY